MGLIDGAIKILKDVKMMTSDDPYVRGLRFENYVDNLFSKKYYAIAEKTHSTETNEKQYIESSMNPDFVYRYKPTNELIAVECKYRSHLDGNFLVWSYPEQLQRYKTFSYKRNIPVYIIIGLGGIDDEPDRLFCIPLEKAKYPNLYPSIYEQFERDPKAKFYWKNRTLY